ncbi:AraC family transcriptional regulator [Allostella vacuolata]|nr:AraC family transcriptional regulator [Stella vacuolata]
MGGHRLRMGGGAAGIERLEASFRGRPFAPHRHDTYAIGITVAGVQTFGYRGRRWQCLPGECHILHPDELHDGAAGTEAGFGYRIAYVDPALIQEALDGRPLPFVADPVVRGRDVPPALVEWLHRIDEPIDGFERLELASALAGFLARHAGAPPLRPVPLRLAALRRVRDLIVGDPRMLHPLEEFERLSGIDRWTIARQFRAAFGTSPSRFRTMRQLDLARRLMAGGTPLSEAALEAGFADQSHLSRQFKRAYGLTPARWMRWQA